MPFLIYYLDEQSQQVFVKSCKKEKLAKRAITEHNRLLEEYNILKMRYDSKIDTLKKSEAYQEVENQVSSYLLTHNTTEEQFFSNPLIYKEHCDSIHNLSSKKYEILNQLDSEEPVFRSNIYDKPERLDYEEIEDLKDMYPTSCWRFCAYKNNQDYKNDRFMIEKFFTKHSEMKNFSATHHSENSHLSDYISMYWKFDRKF